MSPSVEPFNEAKYKALMDGLEISEICMSNLERTWRIDAEFYRKENLAVDSILSAWNKTSIENSFYVSDGNHMSISESFSCEGIPYYRGQDIYHTFIETSSPIRIDIDTFNKPQMLRSHLKKGDVLMSIVGAIIGNSSLVSTDDLATCSCKLSILRSKHKETEPETLFIYIKTKYGQIQIQKFKRGAAQTGLLLEDFDQIYIPVFGSIFQSRMQYIVHLMHDYIKKANLEYTHAASLLEHWIKFPKSFSKESISIKSFKHSFQISGRLDAEYYQVKYDQLFHILSDLPTRKLGGTNGVVNIQKSIEPGSEVYSDEGIPFVRVSDVTKFGITNPEIHLPENIVPDPEKLYPKKDTILFSKDGSVGIAYKMENDAAVITSGALLHLIVKNPDEVLPDYLTLVLNSPIVQLQAERDSNGAIIQHWKPSEIENVIIPILDIEIQKEIAQKVQESFSLRHKAEQLLEYAKQAVEMAIEQGEGTAMEWLESKVSE